MLVAAAEAQTVFVPEYRTTLLNKKVTSLQGFHLSTISAESGCAATVLGA